MIEPKHFLGWDPERSKVARLEMLASRRYCTVAPGQETPPAFSLSDKRLRHLEQLQAGTCWTHAPTQLIETSANALGYVSFPVCRRLLAYVGKLLEGGGNPTDGGDPTDALMAATSEKGAGIAHEALLPYSDSRRDLGTRPPDLVYVDAKACHLTAPVDVRSDDDSRVLIHAGHGVCNGIWWPYGWDDSQTFMDSVGRGQYGHSLYEIGYAKPGVFDQYDWWQLDNWHGLLYPPLKPELAAKVPGYRPIQPDKTSDFWVRGDVYRTVQGYGNFVRVSATDLAGLARGVVVSDFPDLVLV